MSAIGSGGSGAIGGPGGTAGPGRDLPVVRRVRWRLIAWSAGSTVVVLAILGVLIYSAVAKALADESVALLQARAAALSETGFGKVVMGPGGQFITLTGDPSAPGLTIGGSVSGTIAVVVGEANEPVSDSFNTALGPIVVPGSGPGAPAKVVIPAAEPADVIAAFRGTTIVRDQSAGDLSFRMLLTPVKTPNGRAVVEVLADRSAEIRTLDTVFRTLVIGGLLVLAASVVFGYLYAGRALVPIRESLRRQREFAADASHELRTPLSIVRGAADQLRRHRDDPAEVERLLGDVDAGTDRLTRLVDDLLLLARSDADSLELALETVDLGEIAGEATSDFATVAAERDVRLRLDVEPSEVRGDAALLRQLVGILLDNAIRHSPSGGTVTVRTRSAGTLDVEDAGPGIAPEHRERVFDRFWRAPGSPEGGLGLGLAIARSIAERHGGTIRALDREGGGTIFRVSLPTSGGQ